MNFPKPFINQSSGPYSLPESNLVKGLAYWLALLNPLAQEIVTITNNTRNGVRTTFPAVSILEGLPVVFGIQNSTNVALTPVTYAPGTSPTSPAVFGAELNKTAQILTELVGNNLYILMVYQVSFAYHLLVTTLLYISNFSYRLHSIIPTYFKLDILRLRGRRQL